jgi:DNA-binding IclR family transcriptional regulator
METASRGVQSIEVGGRLLAVMAEAAQPLMLRDLASRSALTPAQAHAYLVSFRKLGLVEQDVASGHYRLGPFALQLGLARMRSSDPLRQASTAVVELADELGLMVTVAVWGTFGPTVVQVQEAADQIHVNLRAGTVFSLTGTATGKVFAAFMPATLVEARIKAELREGSRTQRVGPPASRASIAEEIETVRRAGYATAEGAPVPGINALSAPVFDHTGQIQMAITLIGPAAALPIAPGTSQAEALLAFTGRLSAQLGYTPAGARDAGEAAPPAAEKRSAGVPAGRRSRATALPMS